MSMTSSISSSPDRIRSPKEDVGPDAKKTTIRLQERFCEEHRFHSHDGLEIFYRRWPCVGSLRRGAILLFHRGHEHSGRMAHLVDELNLPDFDFYAWDARGHGQSKDERRKNETFCDTILDVQSFVEHVRTQYDISVEDMGLVGQSVGAVQLASWLHDFAPNVRAVTVAAPAFKIKLYVPLARPGLGLMQRLRGNFTIKSYVKPRWLTKDITRQQSYSSDPTITPDISVEMLLGVYDAADRVVADARAIVSPVQVLIAGQDYVVDPGPQHRFFENLASPFKERHVFKGLMHDLLGEMERAAPVAEIRRFMLERFNEPVKTLLLLEADTFGYTRDEFDRMSSPLKPWSPKGIYWRITRGSITLGAKLSDGLKLGKQTGFDSGSTLDYVYRNLAEGKGSFGNLIDRTYLDSIGWRGIRKRKVHVEDMLREGMLRLKEEGMPIRVMDVAAGHGRYVLDALLTGQVRPESVLLRDFSEINVAAGRDLIAGKGLSDLVAFERGDAFDRDGLASIKPRPTLTVVSGLYELFPENTHVSRSLAGIAAAMSDGGYLVYTGQPWHPQLEMIARGLTSHRDGRDWIMRRRTQAEMDQLVAAAGFEKVTQLIDRWGIFTVSLAKRKIS